MKTYQPICCAAVASVTLLLAACGDNGNDNDDPGDGVPDVPNSAVPLTEKADVQREIGNFIDVYRIFFGDEAQAAASRSLKVAGAVVPKAAETTDCERDGSVTEDSGNKPRDFIYFADVSASVAFSTSAYDGCQEDDGDGDGTYTEANGFQESGGGAGTSAFFSYVQFGQGDDAYTELERSEETEDEFEFESIRALFETSSTNLAQETRHVFTLRYEEEDQDEEDGHTAGQVTQGEAEDPFITLVSASGVSVAGPYEYATTECEGGRGRIETDTPVNFDEAGLPVGGAVTVTAGEASVTVTFVNDGSATYQFEGGASGTLTRAEIEAATDGC